MLQFKEIDLTSDPEARPFVKTEVVDVVFAISDGELASREGANTYRSGDAIITGSTGDKWSVSRDRFNLKYESATATIRTPSPNPNPTPCSNGSASEASDVLVATLDGQFRARPIPVMAKQINESFRAARSAGGDMLTGDPGDWLLQYAPGDFGVIANTRFQQVYRAINNCP